MRAKIQRRTPIPGILRFSRTVILQPLIYLALILVLLILILLVVVLLILVIILLILISVLVIHFVTSKNYFADDPLE